MAEILLDKAEEGIQSYIDRVEQTLSQAHPAGLPQSAHEYFAKARADVVPNLRSWLEDKNVNHFSHNIIEGIEDAIREERWEELTDAFLQEISFGTAGIRGRMAFDRTSILKLKEEGIAARILKGPATINDKVLLLKSLGVANFARDRNMNRIVIGYDSRIGGPEFARLIGSLFLACGLTVYLFDEPCPYPELTYAVPNLKADIGILISASHNDYRYNGYKVSCGNGSQFSLEDREIIVRDYISKASTADIRLISPDEAEPDRLWFLGGSQPVEGVDYHGREDRLIDMHTRHIEHVKSFLSLRELVANQSQCSLPVNIGYCAFHGAGRVAVPRILQEVGFTNIKKIQRLDAIDGLFPCFCSDPGKEEQPDPGDIRAARISVQAFKEEYPGVFDDLDILIGTDPDADRCGVVVKVPEDQRDIYDGKDYTLLPADDAWALIIWYRLQYELEKYGAIREPEAKFLTLSHTTSDALVKLAFKHGIGVTKSWVGFAMLAMCVNEVWEGNPLPHLTEGRPDPQAPRCHPFLYNSWNMENGRRRENIAAMEQSNGFSILGYPPPDPVSLGEGGHVRDKDGTFAALLLAEIAAYAKEEGTTLFRLIDEKIFLDPEVGLFINYYEPAPMDGEYDGIQGYITKREVIRAVLELQEQCESEPVAIGGMPVKSTAVYWTGRYDATNFEGFPDEGVRFYFDDEKWNYLTFRPSGTSNALRFHLQLHNPDVTAETLVEAKRSLRESARTAVADIRQRVGAME